jgi:hypothetical protein
MKSNYFSWGWRTVFALFALNLAMAVWSLYAVVAAQEPKRFVYKVIDVPGDTHAMQTALTEHRSGGWELIAVAMGDIQVPRLIFKK